MSWQALAWAAKCHTGSASEKLMLLAYADRHNEETGCAYPSVAWLCDFSSLNRKTVIAAVARLEAAGLISDTGERAGRTKQMKVYRVHLETVPKAVQSLKRNSSDISSKQSQKRDTEPSREPTSPTVATQPSEKIARVPRPDGVSEAVWRDFNRQRKKTLTDTALRGLKREADKAGWTLESALEEATTRGWEGFKADWVKDKRNERSADKRFASNSTLRELAERSIAGG